MSTPKVKRDRRGVWFAQPYLGKTPDGKQIRPRRSFPGARDKAEAQAMADAWYATLTAGGRVRSALLADLLEDYIEQRSARDAAANSVRAWGQCRRWVCRYLGSRIASDVTAADVAGLEQRLLAPKPRGQGLSRSSVTTVHYFLRAAYNWWVSTGICDANPVLPVAHPRADPHEAVAVDEWDYPRLAAALDEAIAEPPGSRSGMSRSACAIAAWISLHTGMRNGEVCALRRRDLMMRRGLVHVGGTMVQPTGGGLVRQEHTKGRKARNVAVTDADSRRISDWTCRAWNILGLACGPDSPLITVDSGFMRPSTVTASFSSLRDELGLPRACTFHSLRHTHATWLLAEGIDIKTVSERLGHADVATTLRVYAHVLPGRDAAAAKAFEAASNGAAGYGENLNDMER